MSAFVIIKPDKFSSFIKPLHREVVGWSGLGSEVNKKARKLYAYGLF